MLFAQLYQGRRVANSPNCMSDMARMPGSRKSIWPRLLPVMGCLSRDSRVGRWVTLWSTPWTTLSTIVSTIWAAVWLLGS